MSDVPSMEELTVTWAALNDRFVTRVAALYALSGGSYTLAPESYPVRTCAGCGAWDHRAGRCTYCGRQT